MNYLRDLIHRLRAGASQRAVARDLGLARLTVQKYARWAEEVGYLNADTPLPEAAELEARLGAAVEEPRVPSGVEPYRAVVEQLRAQGVEMMTVFDRLREQHGYPGSYSSVRRFVQRLEPATPEVVVRVHTEPGEEAQVDFGSAGTLVDGRTGRPRSAWVFVMTLSFSRHQYAEVVFDQTTATWLGLHRRAFEWFGGVPQRVVPDNLKAAVLEASLHDPVLGEAYRRQAQHYGFVVSPTRPRTPEHKGKVESGVHFVKRSFLAGQTFTDLPTANTALRRWVLERAGQREHGTTRQAPLARFEAVEQAALRPLPNEPFELAQTRRVKLHRDCHAVIDGSHYSAPFRFVGQYLDAWIFARVVQLFCGVELVATHPRATERGQWVTRPEHYPPYKAAYLQGTPEHCLTLAQSIGPATAAVVETLLGERPLDRRRAVQALLRLVERVGRTRLEAACARARSSGDVRYRRITQILEAGLDRDALPPVPSLPALSSYTFQREAAEFFGMQTVQRDRSRGDSMEVASC